MLSKSKPAMRCTLGAAVTEGQYKAYIGAADAADLYTKLLTSRIS